MTKDEFINNCKIIIAFVAAIDITYQAHMQINTE